MLYVIKNAEVPEKAMDKARLVLMANLRFAKSGKLLLDRLFFTPGEIWVPASSMAGMRFVAALAILMGFAGGNPDGRWKPRQSRGEPPRGEPRASSFCHLVYLILKLHAPAWCDFPSHLYSTYSDFPKRVSG